MSIFVIFGVLVSLAFTSEQTTRQPRLSNLVQTNEKQISQEIIQHLPKLPLDQFNVYMEDPDPRVADFDKQARLECYNAFLKANLWVPELPNRKIYLFMKEAKFDCEKMLLLTRNYLQYAQKIDLWNLRPEHLEQNMIESDFITVGGYTRNGEAILLYDMKHCNFWDWDVEEFGRYYTYLLHTNFQTHPNIKNVALIDLTHAAWYHNKIPHIKRILAVGYANFPWTVNRFIIYKPNLVVRGCWQIIKHLVKQSTKDEIVIVNSAKDLDALIPSESRLKMHGGSLDSYVSFSKFPLIM